MNLDRKEQPIAWALIILGVLALLSGGGLLDGLSAAVRSLLFILGGVYLTRRYLRDSDEVWALVLALGLFGAALVAFSSGAAVLTLIGVGFAALYWRDKRRWWAVLPAGLFFSIAVSVGFGGVLLGEAPLLFLGFAATFGYLIRLGKAWAVYPAIVALVIALLSTNVIGGSLLPLLLIGGGVYLFANPTSLSSSNPSPSKPSDVVSPASPFQRESENPSQNPEAAKEVDLGKPQAEPESTAQSTS